MNLIRQISAGDIRHRPVAPPHLTRKKRPAPRHQLRAREPQPSPPALAVASVPLTPVPRQLAERPVGTYQVRADCGYTLRQTLHELHFGSRHWLEIRHEMPLCQDHAQPSNPFPYGRSPQHKGDEYGPAWPRLAGGHDLRWSAL